MLIHLLLAFQAATARPSGATGAELVAPGIINTAADEYGPTITPDGRTMYFTLRVNRRGQENIVMSSLDSAGRWTAPQVAPFSGGGFDKEPYLSPDGKKMFFASTRFYPGKDTSGVGEERFDIFLVERTVEEWGVPRPVTDVNSSMYDNYPAVARNGNLYFASHRLPGHGNDLFMARNINGRYDVPRPLLRLNTRFTDADPFIAPDESYIIFSSDRTGGAGQGDLYISFRRNGVWAAPASLGPLVNTADYEYTPFVTADGKWLYFSRGWGEIWRIETRLLDAMKPH